MIVVFGGAYQGKREFVLSEFKLTEEDIFVCQTDGKIDLNKKAIAHLERFILYRIQEGLGVFDFFEENSGKLEESIIICDDISCGVVPVDKTLRLWRDNTGKQMQIFCRKAREVYRVYCGIAERLK
ncbi:MAG: cobalamin biosynthesis protein CobU [Eubacteriaceae bacterium]|nr:cobalamin biosynthesis protein CobU [Eubacteriaceae bacterium]